MVEKLEGKQKEGILFPVLIIASSYLGEGS